MKIPVFSDHFFKYIIIHYSLKKEDSFSTMHIGDSNLPPRKGDYFLVYKYVYTIDFVPLTISVWNVAQPTFYRKVRLHHGTT